MPSQNQNTISKIHLKKMYERSMEDNIKDYEKNFGDIHAEHR